MHKSISKESASHETKPLRVLIAAGGTGGHVYPAIAIADALKDLQPEIIIMFVGTKTHMEWNAVPRAGYNISSIWISGFHRRFTLKNILFPLKLITSIAQSWKIISSFEPDAMISCGGYVAGPVGWAAGKKHIPLFLQEQNSYPGVTNRMLAKKARAIFTAFKEADQYLPAAKTKLTGNPTRKTLTGVNKQQAYTHFGFTENKQTLLVLGGSGGARSINEAMVKNLDLLHDEFEIQLIWQCGKNYYPDLQHQLDTKRYDRLRLVDFINHMPEAYAVADIVISRAGALSCSEIALTGTPSILVPSPNVASDHQTKNAKAMADEGAAKLLKDDEAKDLLSKLVKDLMSNQNKLKEMQQSALRMARPNAAIEIAKEILETIRI